MKRTKKQRHSTLSAKKLRAIADFINSQTDKGDVIRDTQVIFMTTEEKATIRQFAQYGTLRDEALAIHRAHLDDLDSVEQQFMSEVDSPCPDLLLRASLRAMLLITR